MSQSGGDGTPSGCGGGGGSGSRDMKRKGTDAELEDDLSHLLAWSDDEKDFVRACLALDTLTALEDALPVKTDLPGSLTDLTVISCPDEDLGKEENPENRKRKLLLDQDQMRKEAKLSCSLAASDDQPAAATPSSGDQKEDEAVEDKKNDEVDEDKKDDAQEDDDK